MNVKIGIRIAIRITVIWVNIPNSDRGRKDLNENGILRIRLLGLYYNQQGRKKGTGKTVKEPENVADS